MPRVVLTNGPAGPGRGLAIAGFVFILIGSILLFQGLIWLVLGVAVFEDSRLYLGLALTIVGIIFLICGIVPCCIYRKKYIRNREEMTQNYVNTGPVVVGYDPNAGGVGSYPVSSFPDTAPPAYSEFMKS